jgi:hypothetical protein
LWLNPVKICTHCQTKFEDPNVRFCGRDGQPLVDATDPASQSQSPTFSAAPPLSGSLAMALFVGHFIEHAVPPDGLTGPCQPDVRVNIVQFYYDLPIIALWHLRENNLIRFVQATSPQGHSQLGIEATNTNHPSVPGLEFDYWEIIKGCAPGASAYAVLRQFFGKKTHRPEDRLNHRIIEWLINLGYGQADTTPKPFFQFSDNGDRRIFEFVPDCQRIMVQEQSAQKLHRGWTKFMAEEPAIYQSLFQAVIRAGNDASKPQKHIRSVYRYRAVEDLKARSQRSRASPIQTPGEQR